MSFDSLGLSPALLRALADQGYTEPTPIQAAAIPVVLAGRDILAGAQTGTGKTAAFALPLIQRLFTDANTTAPNGKRKPRALILTPTRELAAQVHESIRTYGKHLRIFSTTIFGGVSMGPQMDALRRGLDLIVATPGRLMDHMERRTVDLSGIEILVLDEADRMLDMGFMPAIQKILGILPKKRQTLLFSATFADEIKKLAGQFMRDPEEIQVAARNAIAATITHRVHPVDGAKKRDALFHLLAADSRRQALVFSRTKHGADKLATFLEKSGLKTAAIHGNKSQGARTRALKDFKAGKVTILVATDIAARGLDIDQLPIVVNYDLPMVAEDYVHRIGRTGRAGAEGLAVSLVAHDEVRLLRDIRRMLKQDIQIVPIPGFEPSSPLNLDSNRPAPGRAAPTNRPRNPSHARRPHAGNNSNAKPHAAANKQHRQWRGNRDARKA
jgi:ATP-dependent RNA helicase RhlE